MKKFVFLLAIALFAVQYSCTDSEPNIIVILADDLGYGDISCYNENSGIQTKSIDLLAENGIRFTDAHTSSSVCTPTRYGILTGRYNWRSELKRGVLNGYSKSLIKQERITIAEMLKDQGYSTAYFGKWHLGWDWSFTETEGSSDSGNGPGSQIDFSKPVKNGPDTHGFDYSFGFSGSLDMAPYVWVENGMPTMIPTKTTFNKGRQTFWREGLTADDFDHEEVLPEITRRTVEYIDQHAGDENPFFIYMPLPAPHTPILPTDEYMGTSGLDNIYGDFVIMVDAMVGKVMESLKENDISENTILIFTSDNGCSPRADFDQLESKGHDPSYMFRGHKADIFEGGHRVPFIVQWPKKVKPGTSDQLVCTTDLFATLAEITGATFPDNAAEDSFSFLEAMGLGSDKELRQSIVHHSINGSFAYRKGKYKVNFCPGSGGWSFPKPRSEAIGELPPEQLYDLESDIGEETNLCDQHPEIVEEFRSELARIVKDGRSSPGEPQSNDGPEKWEQLSWMNE